jgi:hypothetical protein
MPVNGCSGLRNVRHSGIPGLIPEKILFEGLAIMNVFLAFMTPMRPPRGELFSFLMPTGGEAPPSLGVISPAGEEICLTKASGEGEASCLPKGSGQVVVPGSLEGDGDPAAELELSLASWEAVDFSRLIEGVSRGVSA